MNRAVVGAALLLAGCGRQHFDQCGPPDAPPDVPPYANANIAFVTSTTHLPTTFGSDRAGADAICNTRAAAAGLSGTYVAWLSNGTSAARMRLEGSRGWVRTDGLPFVDRVDDLALGKIFTPLSVDENGDPVSSTVYVITGTYGDATGGSSCTDYTDPAGQLTVGTTAGTTIRWTAINTINCTTAGRLYCFGVGKNAPLTVQPATGRRAFLTVQGYNVDANGLATADALCASEAQLAGLTGSYRALLATTTATAISRFSLSGPTWVRLDGIPIAESPLAFAADMRITTINVTSAGTYDGGSSVLTGSIYFEGASETYAFSCNDWTNNAGTAISGLSNLVDANFWNNTSNASCFGHPVFCLEE